jgi:membrane protease YdiL (CAAX protease family)
MDLSTQNPFAPGDGWKARAIGFFHFLCFVAIYSALARGAFFAVRHFLPNKVFSGLSLSAGLISAACALLATFIMAKVTGRRFTRYGFGGGNRVRNFLIGAIGGLALLAALLGGLNYLGTFTFGPPTVNATSAIYYVTLYAALFLTIGINEETIFHGYALVSLSRAVSFWPAAILLGVLFGVAHLGNGPREGIMGALSAGLIGVVFVYSFLKTGSLWLAVGLHAGWDYAESFIFGVSDSGMPALRGAIFHPTLHGPDWLTGGTVGPEGSVLVLAPMLAMMILSWILRRRMDEIHTQDRQSNGL